MKMKTILFQGDSITDAGRNRDITCQQMHGNGLGKGYAARAASRIGLDYPGEYTFYNRGIGGNRSVDLYARIKEDILNLKPDYMSILIGVNDVWHEINHNRGVSTEKFIKIYSMLIEEVKAELPDIKIMILEPFVLDGEATHEKIDLFRKEVAEKAAAAKKVAEKYSLPFIGLQADIDELTKKAPADYWSWDGVHPNIPLHQYIADKWVKTFEEEVR